jgi:hypothetical protein
VCVYIHFVLSVQILACIHIPTFATRTHGAPLSSLETRFNPFRGSGTCSGGDGFVIVVEVICVAYAANCAGGGGYGCVVARNGGGWCDGGAVVDGYSGIDSSSVGGGDGSVGGCCCLCDVTLILTLIITLTVTTTVTVITTSLGRDISIFTITTDIITTITTSTITNIITTTFRFCIF